MVQANKVPAAQKAMQAYHMEQQQRILKRLDDKLAVHYKLSGLCSSNKKGLL